MGEVSVSSSFAFVCLSHLPPIYISSTEFGGNGYPQGTHEELVLKYQLARTGHPHCALVLTKHSSALTHVATVTDTSSDRHQSYEVHWFSKQALHALLSNGAALKELLDQ